MATSSTLRSRSSSGRRFGAVVTALVADILTPLITAFGGQPDFSRLTFEINGSTFRYGHFLNALLASALVCAVVFFFVLKPVNALLARRKVDTPADAATRSCPQCLSDIAAGGDALRVLYLGGRARAGRALRPLRSRCGRAEDGRVGSRRPLAVAGALLACVGTRP